MRMRGWISVLGACLLFAPRPATASSFRVSLVGAYREWTDPLGSRRELFGGVSLEVPWQALLGPSGPPVGRARRAEHLAREPHAPARPEDRVPRAPQRGAPRPAGSPPSRADRSSAVDRSLVRDTVRAALDTRARRDPRALLDAMGGRARASAVLPELGLRAERAFDESLRLAPTLSDPYRYTQAGGDALRFEARLTWRLNQLVFTPSELTVARMRQTLDATESALVERVLKYFFAWQGARLARLTSALAAEERFELWLREFESHARLDVLTGGWFGRRVGSVPDPPAPDADPESDPASDPESEGAAPRPSGEAEKAADSDRSG